MLAGSNDIGCFSKSSTSASNCNLTEKTLHYPALAVTSAQPTTLNIVRFKLQLNRDNTALSRTKSH